MHSIPSKFKKTQQSIAVAVMALSATAVWGQVACTQATTNGQNISIASGTTCSSLNVSPNVTSVVIQNDGTILSTGPNSNTFGIQIRGDASTPNVTNTTVTSITNNGIIGALQFSTEGIILSNYSHTNLVGTLTNSSTGFIYGQLGIDNSGGTITNLDNSGRIESTSLGGFEVGIYNGLSSGLITTLTNRNGAVIQGPTAIYNEGTITNLNNSGSLSGTLRSIENYGTIGTLNNTSSGAINASAGTAIFNDVSTAINILNNAGNITGAAWGIENGGLIGALTNSGTISGANGGIDNSGGAITTLNNAQGGSSALTLSGNLPTNYNIIINSTSSYGKLSVINPNLGTTTTFGVYGGGVTGVTASIINTNGKYVGVISGITAANLTSTSVTYNGVTGTLQLETGTGGSTNIWDLCFGTCSVTSGNNSNNNSQSGPTAADTQDALKQSAYALRSVYNMQTAIANNSLSYDCVVFAANNVCVSGGGRFATPNSITGEQMSTLLVAAYKAKPDMRVGMFIDQNVSTPSINGISMDQSPMYGLFGVWNDQADLMGLEARVSSSWSKQNITQTRSVVGTSEAGVGSASLNTQALSGVVSYAMQVPDTHWVASPYAGIRKTKVTRGGYTESSAVSTPLTYSDLNQDITTALAGVRMSKKYGDDLHVTASAGVEQNVGSSISTLDATGVTGLTATDFSANYAKTRPVASVGVSYAVAKDQRISLSAMYRKEAFQSSGSTTGLLMYQVGL